MRKERRPSGQDTGMKTWFAIPFLTAFAAAAQTPADQALALNNQGNRLSEQGHYTEAETPYRQSIDIWRSLGAEYRAHLAGTLLNLGVALSGAGNRPVAVKAYEEALVLH